MKKILFVCHAIGEGGAQRVTTLLANGFRQRGFMVRIVTLTSCKSIYSLQKGIQYIPIDAKQKHSFFRSIYRIHIIKKNIKEFVPDYIISLSAISNMLTILACGLKPITLIVSERTDPSRHPELKIISKVRNILYRYFADKIVFQTKNQKEWFSKGIQKKGIIIPNAVMPGLMLPKQGEKRKIIVGVGSLTDQKDWMTAIKAFEIFVSFYGDYQLIIWGEGQERGKLEAYIGSHEILKKKVILPGYSENVHQEIYDSSLFISTAVYDGISNSILEAMALGLPCVCTDAGGGGARFLIQNEVNGLLVNVGDYQAVANAMIKMINNKEFAQKCASNAFLVRTQYSIDKIMDRWEAILDMN